MSEAGQGLVSNLKELTQTQHENALLWMHFYSTKLYMECFYPTGCYAEAGKSKEIYFGKKKGLVI